MACALSTLILVTILKLVTRILCAYKWYILVRLHCPTLAFKDVLIIHLFGGTIGSIVPLVGSDVTVAYCYYRFSGQAEGSISSVLMDRIIGFYSVIIMGVIGVLLGLGRFLERPVILVSTGIVLLGILGVTLVLVLLHSNPGFITFLPMPARFKKLMVEVKQTIDSYIQDRFALIFNACLSLLVQGLRIWCAYWLALGIGASVYFLDFLSIIPLIRLIGMLPVSANGLGVEEGAYIYFFGMVGISAENAFVISMLGRFLTLVTTLPGALLFMLNPNYFAGDNPHKEATTPADEEAT